MACTLRYVTLDGDAEDDDEDDYAVARRQLRSLGDELLARSRHGDLYVNVSGSLVAVDARRTTTSTRVVCPPGAVPLDDRQVCGGSATRDVP